MDFSLTDEQQAVQDLARQIFEEQFTHERLKALEADGVVTDERVWKELAQANLLGIALPEEVGGSGLGYFELCLMLEQQGRTVAPLPLWPTLVLGALPIAELGTPEQRGRLLPPVVAGEAVLSAALVELGAETAAPVTTARPDGGSWRLEGTKVFVPAGMESQHVLVPAATGEGTLGVFVVDMDANGVSRELQETTSGRPEARIELSGVTVGPGDVLGDPTGGAAVVDWLVDRATVGLCAMAVGVCEAALHLTGEYAKTREQFDRPIATFQAVGQRAANAYIDTEAIRLTTWQAASRLAIGAPASAEVAVAKYWAAEGGQRVVHAAQHLHGGMGVDRDYPLHRYFLWAKHLELSLGGSTRQLLRLGRLLATEPV